jgi:hypothetical protein
VNKGGFMVKKVAAPEPTPKPTVQELGIDVGWPVREAEEEGAKEEYTLGDIKEALGAKVMHGLLVPAGWSGTVEESYIQFRPGTPEAEAAQALAEADPQEAEVEEGAAEPAEVSDEDTEAANAVLGLLARKNKTTVSKALAATAVRQSVPSIKRIRTERWEKIVAASDGMLAYDGKNLVFAAGPETVAPVAELEAVTEPEVVTVDDTEVPAEVKAATPEAVRRPAPEPEPIVADDTTTTDEEALRETLFESMEVAEVFIDAVPLREDYEDFSIWVGQYADQVAVEEGVMHYGTIGYGQGPKKVAAAIKARAHAEGTDILPPVLVVSSSHPLAGEVLAILKRLQGVRFVQGVR